MVYQKSAAKAELLLFGTAVVISGDFTHFTWWAVISLLVSDVALLFNVGTHRSHTLSATISSCVSITVLFLSYSGCGLFSDAYLNLGENIYAVANFAVHYWPSLRLIPRAVDSPVHVHGKWYYADAACLLTLYTALHKPVDVYQCADAHYLTHGALVGLSVGGALFIQFVIAYIK